MVDSTLAYRMFWLGWTWCKKWSSSHKATRRFALTTSRRT
jgi:hypothetical protein